jgi:hypothetical protein
MLLTPGAHFHRITTGIAMEALLKGIRVCPLDLLIKIDCFAKKEKYSFSMKN